VKRLLLLLGLAACAPQPGTLKSEPQAPEWGEIVDHFDLCAESLEHCSRFYPYYRMTDGYGLSTWFVVSRQGDACIVDLNPKLPQPEVSELWTCRWRRPRP
jgi:hypothetical protein